MNKIYTLCLLVTLAFLSACSDHYYAPIMYRNSASYMQKPMSTDSAKSTTYISGGVSTGNGINFTDEFYLGRIDLHHANTFKNFNLAYGVYRHKPKGLHAHIFQPIEVCLKGFKSAFGCVLAHIYLVNIALLNPGRVAVGECHSVG